MERLIADANEYAAANGMAADLSIDSFSDIVTAIDLVQQKQGIAGTTAKEAATTIEGSLNMTKAAWQNLITGLADPNADVGQLVDNLVVAVVGDKEGTGLLNQIIPAVQRAIEGVGTFLQAAIPALSEQLPSLIQSFLPALIQSAVSLVTSLIQELPNIINMLMEILPGLVETVINSLVDALAKAIPILVKQAPQIVKALARGIIRSAKAIGSAGKRLISVLDNAIYTAILALGRKVISYAKKIPDGIKRGLSNLRSVGSNLIEGLWGGIKARFDSVINKVKVLASKLPEAVRKVLGIASPSKVFMELGKWIPEGLALGIERNISSVQDAADAMAGATVFTPDGNPFNPKAAGGAAGGDVFNFSFDYDASNDANDLLRDFARGVQRYRMAGAI